MDIPKDMQLAEVQFKPRLVEDADTAQQQFLPAAALDQARLLIQNAKRPIAYIGGGVHMADAVAELHDFLAQSPMPSVTTLKAMGTVPPSNALLPGHAGYARHSGCEFGGAAMRFTNLFRRPF